MENKEKQIRDLINRSLKWPWFKVLIESLFDNNTPSILIATRKKAVRALTNGFCRTLNYVPSQINFSLEISSGDYISVKSSVKNGSITDIHIGRLIWLPKYNSFRCVINISERESKISGEKYWKEELEWIRSSTWTKTSWIKDEKNDHDHCTVCFVKIWDRGGEYSSDWGYLSEKIWLCPNCYKRINVENDDTEI